MEQRPSRHRPSSGFVSTSTFDAGERYAAFQALYASFLAIYITTVVGTICGCGRLALAPAAGAVRERARVDLVRPLFVAAVACYLALGSTAWLLEFRYCAVLPPAVLHPVWHLGALAGTWLCIQSAAAPVPPPTLFFFLLRGPAPPLA